MSGVEVVYNPPEPHECTTANAHGLRKGAICRCGKCGAYWTLIRDTGARATVWIKMDWFQVLLARFSGAISSHPTEVRDDIRRAD